MMTFFAPAAMCPPACEASVKMPVDSTTISAPRSPHGRFEGSRSDSTAISSPSILMPESVASTSPS